ncbi:hypothetical protein J6590_076827 [Homalodisca vitripennis]|nr:hypothetical protein J6590_076827 [Homalodisca vitripennis]
MQKTGTKLSKKKRQKIRKRAGLGMQPAYIGHTVPQTMGQRPTTLNSTALEPAPPGLLVRQGEAARSASHHSPRKSKQKASSARSETQTYG